MTTASRRPIRTLALLVTLIGLAPVFDRVASAQFTTSCDVGYVNIAGICVYRGHSDEPDTGLQPVDVATGGQTYVIPMATQPAGAPLLGIADLHTHQFADLGFGGVIFHGASYDPRGIDSALSWCDYTGDWTTVYSATGVEAPYIPFLGSEVHGPEGLTQYLSAPISAGTVEGDHAVSGTGDFSGWPQWSTTTHQQMYYKWLERAYQGGLRLIVVHALSNQALCQANKRRSDFTCDDMDAVDKQINAAKELEITIDTMNGGPGKGWYHIAYSPQMARTIIQNGGLAVILGIEVDNLFGCGVTSTCTDDSVRASLQHYYDLGVRHLFPVHVFDNGFGGAALYSNLFNDGNYLINGYFFNAYDCSSEGINFKLQVDALGAILADGINALAPELTYQQMAANCNARGLTPLGQTLVESMINLGMIIDTDHMSKRTRDAVLSIAESYGYPVVSGHSGYPSQGAVDEFGLSDTDIARIRHLGGMVTIPITRGDADPDWCQTSADYPAKFRTIVGKMSGTSPYNDADHPGIAFSTDINGFVPQAAPRFGPKACPGKPSGGPPLLYGIGGQLGGVFGQQWTGNRLFDFNTDGYAHIGMLPDFFRDLNNVGMSDDELAPMLHSAETYIRMWERISSGQYSPDSNPPAITNPGPITVKPENTWGAFVNWTIAATDAWTGSLPVTCAPHGDGGVFPIGVTTETCSAVGSNGVTGSTSFVVTVDDSPALTLPSSLAAEAVSANGSKVNFVPAPQASDRSSGLLPVTCVPASGSTFTMGSTMVACSATDHGETTSGTFTVTVRDTTPPFISLLGVGGPGDVILPNSSRVVTAVGPSGGAFSFYASAVDVVDGPVAATCTANNQSAASFPATFSFAPGTATAVSCTSKDAHGNSASVSFSVVVGTDSTGPVIAGVPPPSHMQDVPGSYTNSEDSLDDFLAGGNGQVFYVSASGDACGALAAQYNAAHPNYPAPACLQITANDAFDGPRPVTCSTIGQAPDQTIALDNTAQALHFSSNATWLLQNILFNPNVSCSSTDLSGNTSTSQFTVAFEDDRPLIFSNVPNDIWAAADASGTARVWFTNPSATDPATGASVPVSCSPPSSYDFPVGDNPVSCMGETWRGGQALFTVHVSPYTAGTAIELDDTSLYTDAIYSWADNAWETAVTSATFWVSGGIAQDTGNGNTEYNPTGLPLLCALDGAPLTSCTSPISYAGLGLGVHNFFTQIANLPSGTPEISDGFTWTILSTPPVVGPVIVAPAPIVLEATGPHGAPATYTVSATDSIDGSDPATCDAAAGTIFPLGATIVTCSATDSWGYTGSGQFTVTVNDTTPPVMPTLADITVPAIDATGAAVTLPALQPATDIVDGTDAVTCVVTGMSGSWFPVGDTTVMCTSTDQHGNTASASLVVRVQDTTAPVVAAPADQTVVATGSSGAAVTFTVSATDNVDVHVAVVCSPASGTTFPIGATTVRCEAIDRAGNVSQPATFTVHITDVPPVLTVPANLTLAATSASGAVATFTASATDLADGTAPVVCSPASASTFPLGTTIVSCSATNKAGLSVSASFSIVVNDTTPPVISGVPANQTVSATSVPGAIVIYAMPTASDLVDGNVVVHCAPASGATFAVGTTNVACAATDAHGNSSSASFSVTVTPYVTNTKPPKIAAPKQVTKEATGPNGAVVTFHASATDPVDGSIPVTCLPMSDSTFPLGTTTVTCSATNAAGTSATASITVTVRDTKAPTLDLPDHQVVEATGPAGAVVTFVASATDIVDGLVPVVCVPATGSMFPLGTTTVSCSATDHASNTKTGSFDVTARDTTSPTILSVTPSPAQLPDSDQMVRVVIAVVATDLVDPAPACQITKVTDGATSIDSDGVADWAITGPLTLNVDAVARQHKGRTYSITVKCADFAGNESKEKTTVVVSLP